MLTKKINIFKLAENFDLIYQVKESLQRASAHWGNPCDFLLLLLKLISLRVNYLFIPISSFVSLFFL